MQTENEFYAQLDKDQDANLVELEEIDITIEDRIRILKKVDLGSLISSDCCDSLMGTMVEYFESLDCKSDLNSAELSEVMHATLIVAAYDITYKMFQDELKNGEHHERLLADVQS